MQANQKFLGMSKDFWANVRLISQSIGYTDRTTKEIRVPNINEMVESLSQIGLRGTHLKQDEKPTELGSLIHKYFAYRADILNNDVRDQLMNKDSAKKLFEKLKKRLNPTCPMPMNKQTGEKKAPAYFTCIVNMLIEGNSKNTPCDYDPRQLTSITRNGHPLRTLARRVDGAFPSTVNPIAIWEIKEYYYTTTFGSRVADGVYETLLDGLELEELMSAEKIKVMHYLMLDDYYTWWDCGKSYLCRIIDMLHMGYVDEVIFGKEVINRLPQIVAEWVAILQRRTSPKKS